MNSSRVFAMLLSTVLAFAACSQEPSDVIVATESDSSTAAVSAEPEPVAAEDNSAEPVQATTTTTTSTAPEEVTTTTVAETTTTTTTIIDRPEVVDTLGSAMIGLGEWIVLRDPAAEGAEECSAVGTLAYSVDSQLVHVYDELGDVGSIRLFNGTRGQDAFVINCEESVERILLQGSAIMPDTGWPELTDIKLYGEGATEVYIGFTSEMGWRGDVFSAYASFSSPSREELVGFDTVSGEIFPIADRVGTRSSVNADHDVDLVVPAGWSFEDTDGYLTLASDSTQSRIQVRRVAESGEPLAEGDEFLSSDSARVRLWMRPDADGASSVSQVVDATDTTFVDPDGLRLVRQVAVGDEMVEVELFVDDAEAGASKDLPWLVLDLLRVIDPASN